SIVSCSYVSAGIAPRSSCDSELIVVPCQKILTRRGRLLMTQLAIKRAHVKRALATLLLFLHVTGSAHWSAASSLALRSLDIQAKSDQPADTLDSLRERIAAHIGQQKFTAAQWGVKIVSLDTGKTIFEHNAQKFFNPAS